MSGGGGRQMETGGANLGLRNPVLERLAADELAIGLVTRLARSGEIARIALTSGYDFLFIDIQHSIYSLETISHIAQAAQARGVAPFARARSCRDADVPALLDCGLSGIVFPDVNTAADARRAVSACKFAPIGTRSVTGPCAAVDYRKAEPAELIAALNATTVVVCMIESREGVANVEEICAVEGIDAVLIGCTDLLADMGKPGRLDDPELAEALAHAISAARAAGVHVGVGGDNDLGRNAGYIRQGARLFTTQSDIALLLAGGTEAVSGLRALQPSPSADFRGERP